MANGFEINPQGIREIQRELEREFAKHPIRVPLTVDAEGVAPPHGVVVNYHGPVVTVHGDHAQLAWNNETVNQHQDVEDIAVEYAQLADVVTQVLALLDRLDLSQDDADDARSEARGVLTEVTNPSPDRGVVRRGVTMLKGLLAAAGAGVGTAVTAETAEHARQLIELLGSSLPG